MDLSSGAYDNQSTSKDSANIGYSKNNSLNNETITMT